MGLITEGEAIGIRSLQLVGLVNNAGVGGWSDVARDRRGRGGWERKAWRWGHYIDFDLFRTAFGLFWTEFCSYLD